MNNACAVKAPFTRCIRAAAASLGSASFALAGCTALQPIPPHADDFRFPARVSEAAKEKPQCQPPNGSNDECIGPALPLQGYFGGLAQTIWDVDLERRRFARLAAEKTNQAVLFNAMLWPVGAYVGARNLAEPRASLLRDAGAFSLAVHGLLGSGISDRDSLYFEASRLMACAISLSSGHLYAKADIGTLDAWAYPALRTLRPGMADLAAVQLQLKLARDAFRDEQSAVLAALETRTTASPGFQSAGERRRREVAGGGSGGGVVRRDTVGAFGDSAVRRLDQAKTALKRLDEINGEILRADAQLKGRHGEIRRRLDKALIDRAPTLVEPSLGAGQVVAALNKITQAFAAQAAASGVTAASATAKSQGGQARWQLDEKMLAPLTPASRQRLKQFEAGPGLRLQQAIDDALGWREAYDNQLAAATNGAAESGCSAELFRNATAAAPAPAASLAGS